MPSSPKIFIHYLFRPYLPKDEHLLWVGETAAPLMRFRHKPQVFKKLIFTNWRIPLIYALLYPILPDLRQMPFAAYLYLLDYAWFLALAALLYFLLNELFLFGREYYAISNKRLLVLRRALWKSIDAALLGLLPDFQLDSQRDKSLSIRFAPIRIEEINLRGLKIRIEQHRPHLEKLSRDEAEAAYQQLTKLKNAVLDERARAIGLMK